jgi:hypothetical protein
VNDIAQQIRDRLDDWAPTHADSGHQLPSAFIALQRDVTVEEATAWQAKWDELMADATIEPMRLLPAGPRFYAGFEQMRAALLAVLDEHQPEQVDYPDADGESRSSADCVACDTGGVSNSWPCSTVTRMAKELGIEVAA